MAQLHFYVDKDTETELRRRAESAGVSLSRYLADIARGSLGGGWPEGWFGRTSGKWVGPPQKRESTKPVGDLKLPFD